MSTVAGATLPASAQARLTRRVGRWVWFLVVLLLAAFASLAYAAYRVPYFAIDLDATRAVQAIPFPGFHALMVAVSWPGFPPQVYVCVVLISISFYATRQRRQAVFLLLSAVGIACVSQGVKLLVDRPRPPAALVHVLIPNLNGGHWSFPAGHVESYVVIFGFIAYVAYRGWHYNLLRGAVIGIGLLMIALIGVSRVDSGEHWLSDAVGGYLLGSAFLLVVIAWYQHGPPAAAPEAGAAARDVNRVSPE